MKDVCTTWCEICTIITEARRQHISVPAYQEDEKFYLSLTVALYNKPQEFHDRFTEIMKQYHNNCVEAETVSRISLDTFRPEFNQILRIPSCVVARNSGDTAQPQARCRSSSHSVTVSQI